jgi:hypothetical protein
MKGVQKRMGDLSSLAKLIIAVGVFLVLGGGLLLLLGKMGIPLGIVLSIYQSNLRV